MGARKNIDMKAMVEEIIEETAPLVGTLEAVYEELNSTLCVKCRDRCCCLGCRSSNGYFYEYKSLVSDTPVAKGYVEYLKETYGFDNTSRDKKYGPKSRGFWRSRGGCVLPRGLRSYTCLSYDCSREKGYKLLEKPEIIIFKGVGVTICKRILASYLTKELCTLRVKIVMKYWKNSSAKGTSVEGGKG